jgi:hypothetical protein
VRPGEILRNTVKEKLVRGEVVTSMTVRLIRTIEIARIAKTAGTDLSFLLGAANARATEIKGIKL